MTIPVQTIFTSSAANGTTTVFPYSFKITDSADLEVSLNKVVQTSGYTVSGVGETAGGNVTFTTAPANGVTVLRALNPILKRVTDYQQFGDWAAATVNLDFDRMWLALQKFANDFKRALKLPVDTATDQIINSTPTQRADSIIGFNSLGDLYTLALSAFPVAVSAGSFTVDTFSGTGAQTAFTLSRDPGIKNNTSVYVGGVYQRKDQYSVTGAVLTFNAAPALGTNNIEVAQSVALIAGTPADNTVSVNSFTSAALSTLSASLGYTPAGTGAVASTVQAKLRERVSVKDFGATGDGTTNDAAAIRLAMASNRGVYFPAGTYLIKSALVASTLSNFALYGDGPGVSIIKCHATDAFANSALAFSTCNHFYVSGLTIDQNNNASFSATRALVTAVSSTDFSISQNEIIRFTYIGLSADSCLRFWLQQNRIERDVTLNTTNYTINVSSSASVSGSGVISGNLCKNAGSIYKGKDIIVSDNVFDGNKYGGGIVTSGNGTTTYGEYVVTGNICKAGTGIDADSVNVAGMEIDGYYCTVNNNLCYSNGGVGIAMLGYRSTLQGNVCFGNGVNGSGASVQAGIAMGYVSATNGAHYCHVSGNACFDIGASTQLYGYYEQSALLVGNAVTGNKFDGNITGDVFLQGTAGFYETQKWTTYTPTVTSTTGTITTVGAVSGRYRQSSKMVFFQVSAVITTNGTGGGRVSITLPTGPGAVSGGHYLCTGRGNTVSSKMLTGSILNAATAVLAANFDGTYPGADGETIVLSGFYEVA